MNICGIPIHNFEGFMCVEMSSIAPFGLNFEYLSYYQTHLKTMGYNSVLFIQRPTGEVFIHLQAFFLLLISKVTLQSCWHTTKSILLTFFDDLFKMFLKSLESHESVSRTVQIDDYIDYLDLRPTQNTCSQFEPGLPPSQAPPAPPHLPTSRSIHDSCSQPTQSISEMAANKYTGVPRNNVNNCARQSFQCTVCGMNFKQAANLKSHIITHSDERQHQCPICGNKFKRQNDMKKHMLNHTEERNHECPECGLKHKTRRAMKSHMRSHSTERPFECTECGKRFKRIRNLKEHTRFIHLKEKPFQCKECNVCFSKVGTLKRHMISHTDERSHACPECDKKFKTRQTLREHMKVHTAEEPVECPQCGKKVKNNRSLTEHLKIHSGETPHACPECGKKFLRKRDVKYHMYSHSRERPHQCVQCGKKFTLLKYLKSHQQCRSHRKKKRFECQECNVGYDYRLSLQHHMIKVHNAPPPEPAKGLANKSREQSPDHISEQVSDSPSDYSPEASPEHSPEPVPEPQEPQTVSPGPSTEQ